MPIPGAVLATLRDRQEASRCEYRFKVVAREPRPAETQDRRSRAAITPPASAGSASGRRRCEAPLATEGASTAGTAGAEAR